MFERQRTRTVSNQKQWVTCVFLDETFKTFGISLAVDPGIKSHLPSKRLLAFTFHPLRALLIKALHGLN